MQHCPTCHHAYSDDTASFCPHDATPLIRDAVASGLGATLVNPPYSNMPPTQQYAPPAYSQGHQQWGAPQAQWNAQPVNQPAYVQPPSSPQTMPSATPHNPMRKWVQISKVTLIVSAALLLLFLIIAVSTRVSNPLGLMAAIFGSVGLLFGILGLFSYGKQATTIDEMLKQSSNGHGNLLAHWTYSPQEWSQFVQAEISRNKTGNTAILYVLGFVFLIIIGRALLGTRGGVGTLIALLISLAVVGGILFLIWWAATAEARKLKTRRTGEAFISSTGLLFNDSYYPWNVMGTRLMGIFYEQGNPNVLLFNYQQWGSQNVGGTAVPARYNKSVRVPVPFGREVEAQNLVACFPR